jgi:hypothetical protein
MLLLLLAGEAVYVDEGFIPGDEADDGLADDDGLEEDEEDDGAGE